MVYVSIYQSPLGEILLAANQQGLTGLWLEGEQPADLLAIDKAGAVCESAVKGSMGEKESGVNGVSAVEGGARDAVATICISEVEAAAAGADAYAAASVESLVLAETTRWLDIYFEGKEPDFMPPLYMTGSSFRLTVWEILRQIPYGETITYGEIARQIAEQRGSSHMSAQAVGGAVGHNEISIIVPCHRVVGANGSLTGYASGIDKKIKLLTLEGVDMSRFFVPKKGTAL